MPTIKLTGITSICAAGVVIQPDENGLVTVPDEVLTSPDFIAVCEQLGPGQIIEGSSDAPKGKKPLGTVTPIPESAPEAIPSGDEGK